MLGKMRLWDSLTYLKPGYISLLLENGRTIAEPSNAATTVFHVTQYKAGSQWIYNILLKCAPERLVHPEIECAQFIGRKIVPGKIYPAVYLPRTLFIKKALPMRSRRFVVLRDLRDILVSAYFSLRNSHPELGNVSSVRRRLSQMSQEEGFLWMLRQSLPWNAVIFETWVKSEEPWIKYEDLLVNDVEILERALINQCELEVDRDVLRQAIINSRFEKLSGGRPRGVEEPDNHYRKGIAGDWRNYFTKRVKAKFKRHYGRLLIEAGYETDLNW